MSVNNHPDHYDVIVLGLGIMGSATAYQLTKDGKRVLGLEQFALDHSNGSSYGESRIIRYAYENAAYTELMKSVFPMWHDLEAESGRSLIIPSGGFDFGDVDAPSLINTRNSLESAGIPFDWLTPAEASRKFPQFHLDANMRAIYQKDAGILPASICVRTLAEMAQKYGATLQTGISVKRVEPLGNFVRVHTENAIYEAEKLIITAGPWAGKVLGALDLRLPLQPTREEQVFYLPEKMSSFVPETFPIFICHQQPWFYGLPNVSGTGLKVAVHCRGENVDPDQVKRTPDHDYIAHVTDFVRQYLPDGEGKVSEARICLYTMTPDENFIVDQHPAYPNIYFGAGFSGHGFKFGVLIGRILADLATQDHTKYPIHLFNVKRFLSERK